MLPPSSMTPTPRKAGHLYKKTDFGRSWRLRFFSLEGSVLYYYKREGDPSPKGIVELPGCLIRDTRDKKFYSFRLSHPKSSKVYDLAATLPRCTQDWIQALNQATTTSYSSPKSEHLTYCTSSSGSASLHVDPSIIDLVTVVGAPIPNLCHNRIETLLAEFIAHSKDDVDGWKFQMEQRGVKAYVRRACRLKTYKGVGFVAQHPHKVLKLLLDPVRRQTYDPQLLMLQRVHVFNDQTWVDHLTYKAAFPSPRRDFVNLMHWRVLSDGSIVMIETHVKDDNFLKSHEPQIIRNNIIMAGFLLVPNENYTGVTVTYISKMDVITGLPTKMLIKRVFLVDGVRQALEEDDESRHWERVTNDTVFNTSTKDSGKDKDETNKKLEAGEDQDEHLISNRPSIVPEEGFPAVPEEYSEVIEKAVVRVEAELNDNASWNSIGEKAGVKAYTKIDGSLTAVKGVGFLPYHPRAIWDQCIDVTKRKIVDSQLAMGVNLKKLNAQTTIDYMEYKSILVVAGRDFCNLTHWRVLPGGTIIVVVQSMEDHELCPLKEPKVVRAEVHLACIVIEPNATYDGAMVTTLAKTDLKGNIPARIAGKAAADQPFVIARMGEVIKGRHDLDQLAAQGKVTNTLFELPKKKPSSLSNLARKSHVSMGMIIAKASNEKTATQVKTTDKEKSNFWNTGQAAMYTVLFGGALWALNASAFFPAFIILLTSYFALNLHLRSIIGILLYGYDAGTLEMITSRTNKYLANQENTFGGRGDYHAHCVMSSR